MSEYEKLNKEHAARMKQFGDDLKLIRARVRAERSGLLPRQELSKIEILEARYNEKVSSFSRVFAEALFNSYLLEISGSYIVNSHKKRKEIKCLSSQKDL